MKRQDSPTKSKPHVPISPYHPVGENTDGVNGL